MSGYIWVDIIIIRVNIRVNFEVVGKKNPEKKVFEKNPAERSAFSESPGRETPILKIWAQSELKNPIFGQIGNLDRFFANYHHFSMIIRVINLPYNPPWQKDFELLSLY